MQFRIHSLLSIFAVFVVTACDVHVSTNNDPQNAGSGSPAPVFGRPGQYSGAGVTFLTPLETANVNFGTTGINYESKNLKALTDGKTLIVNGKNFGEVHAGDVVDFNEPGLVKVNGTVRQQNGT